MCGARVLLRLPAGHPGRARFAAGAHAADVPAAERQRHAREPARMLAVRHITLRVCSAGSQTPRLHAELAALLVAWFNHCA